MKKEFRNIAIYIYLGFKLLFKGKFQESYYSFCGAFIRSYEFISNLVSKPKVKCNYCGWEGNRFKTLVVTVRLRKNAVCPQCLSLDRHREMLEVFQNVFRSLNKEKISVLDIAPNIAFSNYCKANKQIDYLSVDLQSHFAMRHMDIQEMPLDSNSFDVLVCYHVLDYVKDDSKAMREMYRVLKDDGIAITKEGIYFKNEKTIEWGKAIPEEMYRIRQYGNDFFERWANAGFHYTHIKDKNIILSGKHKAPNYN